MKFIFLTFVFSFLTEIGLFGQGTIIWDEAVNGELGKSPASATSLGILLPGYSSILGRTEFIRTGSGGAIYEDLFTFSVGSGNQIDSVQLTIDRQIASWLGDQTYSSQLGYVITPASGELLSQFLLTSLASGHYGMYVGNFDFQSASTFANYRLDFVVTPVPEPSVWALLTLGGAVLWGLARRRK